METPPPRWVRRLFITPLVFFAAAGLVLLSPILHLVAAVLDLIFDRRRFRLTRFVGLGLAFCATEVFGLFTMLTVWIGSGFGWYMNRPFWIRANMVLCGQYMELITRAIRFYLGFGFHYTFEPFPADRPIILFSRHAGPGDAFLIIRVIIRDSHRQPHFVGAAKLQWDPFLDIIGERLDNHFLLQSPADPEAELQSIRDLAGRLGGHESLCIFPEGGNFTPARRRRILESLKAHDRTDRLRRGQTLKHTLLPKTGGTVAALEGAPDAVVLFVAHAGLEELYGFADLWSAVPLNRSVLAHSWTVLPDERPTDRDGLTAWLFDEWQKVDDWVDEQLVSGRTEGVLRPAPRP